MEVFWSSCLVIIVVLSLQGQMGSMGTKNSVFISCNTLKVNYKALHICGIRLRIRKWLPKSLICVSNFFFFDDSHCRRALSPKSDKSKAEKGLRKAKC